jgi:hypothetical protein
MGCCWMMMLLMGLKQLNRRLIQLLGVSSG